MSVRHSLVRSGALAVCVLAGACSANTTTQGDVLPGRSRPLLTHDWPDPGALVLEPSRFAAPDPDAARATTASGVRAYVIPDSGDRVARITVALPLGRLHERPGEEGGAGALARALARTWSGSLAAGVEVEQHLDVTTVSIEVLPEDWREALHLVVGLLRDPKITDGDLAAVGQGYAQPTAGVAGDGFRPAVELARMAGGHPVAAQPGVRPTRAAVLALAERSLAPRAVVFGIGGRIDRSEVLQSLENATAGWSGPEDTGRPPARLPARRPAEAIALIDEASLEGWIAIGRVIDSVPPEEPAALAVAADIVGTRLNIAAREARGLANRNVLILPGTATGAGLLHVRTGGRPEAVAPLVRVTLDELARAAAPNSRIEPRELERAQGALVLGAWQESLDGARRASATYAIETVRHGGLERLLQWPAAVRAVTAEQVRAAAAKYLDPGAMTTVIVGPIEKIRAARHPRWPTTLDMLQQP